MDRRKKENFILVCILLDVLLIAAASILYLQSLSVEVERRDAALQVDTKLCAQMARTAVIARQKAPYLTDSPLVNTALSQLGNKGGNKFWKWYGFKYQVPWCACFVSWCGDKNGYLEKQKIPRFAYVPEGVAWFKDRRRWKKSGVYMPRAGDLIFFRKKKEKTASHVGIVASVFDDRVYVVSGNQKNRCRKADYKLTSYKILGYGLVNEG